MRLAGVTIFALLLPGVSGRTLAQAADSVAALRAGESTTHQIRGGDEHRFRVAVRRGDFVRFSAAQHEVDVEIEVRGRDGRAIASRGALGTLGRITEFASVVSLTAQDLLVVVRAEPPATTRGHYELRVDGPRAATDDDRRRVRAESLYAVTLTMYEDTSESERARAHSTSRDALDAVRLLRPDRHRAGMLSDLASALYSMGAFDSALAVVGEAHSAFQVVDDTSGVARTLMLAARFRFETGDRSGARPIADSALALARRARDRMQEATSLNNIGHMVLETGQSAASIPYFEQARDLYLALGATRQLGATLNNLANAHLNLTHYDVAIDFQRQHARHASEAGDVEGEGRAYNNIGAIYRDLGRVREARDNYDRAIARWRSIGYERGLGAVLTNVGSLIGRQFPDSAIALYEEALKYRERTRDRDGEVATAYNMGYLHYQSRNYAKAREHLLRAAEVNAGLGDRAAQQFIVGVLARVHAALDEDSLAFARFRESVAISDSIGDRRTEAVTRTVVARALRIRNRLGEAREELERALVVWDAIRESVSGAGLQASLAAQYAADYRLYIDVLAQQWRSGDTAALRTAFEASERARGRGLLDQVSAVRSAIRATVDSATRSREDALRRELASAGRLRDLGRRRYLVDSLLIEIDRFEAAVRRSHPGYAAVSQAKTVAIADVQRSLLDSSTVLVHYHVGDSSGVAFVVTRDTLAGFMIPGRAAIDSIVRRLYGGLVERGRAIEGEAPRATQLRLQEGDRVVRTAARQLGSMLLEPAAALIRNRRVAISPGEGMHHLPFAVLPLGSDEPARLLGDAREVVIVPSVATLAAIRERRAPAASTGRVALIGDPTYGDRSSGPVTRASTATDSLAAQADTSDLVVRAARASGVADGAGLPPLPFAKREIESIARLAGPRSARILVGSAANVDTVVSGALRHDRILHFATHALLNDDRPELTGIALSTTDQRGKKSGGLLQLHHLYQLDLSAELVTLSACQTALGSAVDGEGPSSLARGFIAAGAASVVSSLWKVDDEATSVLMDAFYRAMLRNGARPAAALRDAQQALRSSRRWSAPYYWAAFTIQGEWR